MKKGMKKTLLASCLLSITTANTLANGLVSMTDEELSAARGQALISMAYTAPKNIDGSAGDGSGSGSSGNYLNYGYYKLGLEAKMELNTNIRSLQLGCGGINGAGQCDIDIENLSLSGPADSVAADGTPIWTKGRANTSALLTNPFIEFAIKNPTSAALREVAGFRLSAEDILGHLSAGTLNDYNAATQKSTGGGINTFSGYIQVAPTPVDAKTNPSIFGTRYDEMIFANVRINTLWWNDRSVFSSPSSMTGVVNNPNKASSNSDQKIYDNLRKNSSNQGIYGILVPQQNVSFEFPQTAVTGNRMSQLNLVVNDVPIAPIAIGRDSGGVFMALDESLLGVPGVVFFMGADGAGGTQASCAAARNTANCSYITNLKVNATVKENFNLVHNLPISSGGYLSLQKEALRWPGSSSAFTYNRTTKAITNVADNYSNTDSNLVFNKGDIAQPGWWLSFKDPLDFGKLVPTNNIPMDDVLPQIATYITNYLSNTPTNNIDIDFGTAVTLLFGAPVFRGLGDIKLSDSSRAVMVMENLQLNNYQQPVSNCFGNLKFC
ncbi:hypothetical protein F900_02557 [Acinetobacter modestus]|uniref:Uncharacterized protein n=1 Tax=Acinetobacter modestus TaxID=1776740 RepID=N9N9C9_9GAMM|nr:hypothetical protein [Acinetobacter modestus]ENW99391.1 hypothetical protein F900_02557 [Acinetobacter modestus]